VFIDIEPCKTELSKPVAQVLFTITIGFVGQYFFSSSIFLPFAIFGQKRPAIATVGIYFN
jgi:hypothetical protein